MSHRVNEENSLVDLGAELVGKVSAGLGGRRELIGEPSGTRTQDPLIKSQVL